MINERQETIADVVAKMLEFAETDSQTIGRDVLRRRIQNFARRFEAAHQREVAELKSKMNDVVCENEAMRDACWTCCAKRECEETREKSSQVGNAAKMREALERIRRELILDSCRRTITKFHDIVCEVSYSALVAPPRNCDVLSKAEVLETLKDRSFSKEDTIEWLYAEAKGEAK